MLFEKAEGLANTYKSRGLSCKLPKRTRYIYIYIYIREFFILIISLHASYGHNIFTKISHWSLYDKLLMVDKKIIMSLVGPNENQ